MLEYYKNIAKNNGVLLLSNNYTNSRTKMLWQCKDGHTWYSRPTNIQQGQGCPKCAHKIRTAAATSARRSSIEECREFAKRHGGKCLSLEYSNNITPLKWQCKDSHIWSATFKAIKRNKWCPQCHSISLEDCQMSAANRGGKCLSSRFENVRTSMLWECENGHVWNSPYQNIKRGNWCLECQKLSIEDCYNVASDNGGACLSSEYTNIRTKILWQCAKGHTWRATYASVGIAGTWCPMCKNKTENKLYNILCKIFKHVIRQHTFDWLKTNRGGIQRIDFYIPDIKVAIEYDGKQHFEPIEIFGGVKKFKEIKRLDKLKNKKIASNTKDVKYFIRFNYKDNLSAESVIIKLLEHRVPFDIPDDVIE